MPSVHTAPHPSCPAEGIKYNLGLEQSLGKYLVVDGDYFWKFTDNAFDFSSLLNTPIQFPISWRKSKIDGVAARLSTPDIHGFQAFVTLGHTRARYFGPSNGGLIFNSPLDTGGLPNRPRPGISANHESALSAAS